MTRLSWSVWVAGGLLVGVIGVRTAAPADETKRPERNARQVLEGYIAAALTGKTEEAAALAEPGVYLATKEGITDFKHRANSRPEGDTLEVDIVLASEKKGEALAVSAPVSVKSDEKAGDGTARLVFTLRKTDKGWLVRTCLGKSHEDAKEIAEDFRKAHADVKELPAKPRR